MGRTLGRCTLVFALAACGGSSGNGGSGSDAAPARDAGDATADATHGPDDSGPDALADASDEASDADLAETGSDAGGGGNDGDADGGIPPLSCSGDMNEPDDTQVLATPLGMIDDCDSSGSTLASVSSGMGDVDWSYYAGTDTTGCVVDPTVQIDAPDLEVCMFFVCASGTTTVNDCGGGSAATSPAGTPGCCIVGTTSMTAKITCSNLTSDSADVYMRVRQPSSDVCVPYDLAYHF